MKQWKCKHCEAVLTGFQEDFDKQDYMVMHIALEKEGCSHDWKEMQPMISTAHCATSYAVAVPMMDSSNTRKEMCEKYTRFASRDKEATQFAKNIIHK